MNEQVSFTLRGRNPDVLTCIANLSNDEVFTPPEVANRMLDALASAWASDHEGANLWANKSVKFLDPFTKSGVFLREITSRLNQGLANEIPDLQTRVNHILTQQVFGIGITRLTSLLARRSLYCSKWANGPHSVAKGFTNESGNIWFERTKHKWAQGKCTFVVPLNGECIANTSTSGMKYTLGEVLAHLSKSEHLYPGELIATGTLPNGCGMEVGGLLKAGDHLKLTIDGVGDIVHTIA